ncbi:hypothetical protein RFI_39156 [Reticulomyxa filosa]|uniref:Uncharacterized protein n=1 Tax=Reticulomyxa filosa TaxID=46433 RepID=X6LAH7_RETFI|nr:hypothetical protein RFI_39156 [Reticulomyxa filosa]|eukprot:ETN98355.1 hypothetical protein RFI_39156 [Reticulomyxa filosa]
MGYPLQLYHICAVLLYCGKSCTNEFSYDQIKFRHDKWHYLDFFLHVAIRILHFHERREESEMEFYCGLKGVRFENIEKEIKFGYFISHVSTSDDIQVAKMFRGDQGCILHFHSSMRRALGIFSCDVSWISPFKHEREILFAKSLLNFINDENTHKKTMAWNANVENEDEYTQMILLTWTEYDEHIQQIVRVNEMFNYSIDFNLIYFVLKCNKKNIIHTRLMLHAFEKWRRNGNDKKYKERMKEFVEERCCNYNINLFCMFLSEKKPILNAVDFAKSVTVSDGLPFVEKDRNVLNFLM